MFAYVLNTTVYGIGDMPCSRNSEWTIIIFYFLAYRIILYHFHTVQSENFLCGDNLVFYDASKSKCENGHVITLNASKDSNETPFSETPAKYLCGPSYVPYDISVHDCIDGKLVMRKNHHSDKGL